MIKARETDRLSTGKKFTKAQVNYGPSSDPCKHRCGICEFHLHVPGTHKMECGVVEGPIKDAMGCKLFEIDLIHAAMHPLPKSHK